MKNRFLWLLILGVALFTACSDDDDKPLIAPSDLNTTFGEGETTLNMTYGGAALIGKQVKFSTTNSKTATLTLTDVIPGQAETTIDDIQLVEDNDNIPLKVQLLLAVQQHLKVLLLIMVP